jgi:signal transduction histidine kinase
MPRRERARAADSPRQNLAVKDLGDVMGQMRLINGIFAALNSSIETEDLHLILLTILTTPRGLGFTRAHLFVVGDDPKVFHGRLGLGCRDAEELEFLEAEIATEEAQLAKMAMRQGPGQSGRAVHEGLDDLRNQSWWITAYQRAAADNPLTEAIRGRALWKAGLRSPPRVLAAADRSEIKAMRVRAGKVPRSLDPETAGLLGEDFVLGPLRTKRGVRAIVAADKAFQPEGITRDDMANFEWLCNQASLALENAELYDDLRRAYSEIEAVDAMKSNFLSIISHELRTPLTSILGFVQLIRDGRVGEINATVHRLLDKVVMRSRDLTNLINDLLEIAELQAGGLVHLELEPVATEDAVEEAIQREEQRRHDLNVTIEHRRPSKKIPPILGDEQALARVLRHIIDNAVKFNREGGKVTIRHRATARHVEISIRDNGPGMAEGELQKIFDHFYQADGDLTRAHGGVGLGLSIVKKVLSCLNGQIEIESRPGRGTTVRVTFPRAPTGGNGAA